jgi:nitrogen fixation-related uncharacterized protein
LIINSNDSKRLIVKSEVDIGQQNFVNFWEICSSLRNLNDINKSTNEKITMASVFNSYFFYSLFDNDTFDDNLASSLINISVDSAKGTTGKNIGKIVGIIIISLIVGIILFMLIINLIQYKLRSEQFDDFDENDGEPWTWRRTFSVQSLKRSLSLTSLRRSKKDISKNMKANMTHSNLKCNEISGAGADICDSSDSDDIGDDGIKIDKKTRIKCRDETFAEQEEIQMLNDESNKTNSSSVENNQRRQNFISNKNENSIKNNHEKEKQARLAQKNNEDLGYYSRDLIT